MAYVVKAEEEEDEDSPRFQRYCFDKRINRNPVNPGLTPFEARVYCDRDNSMDFLIWKLLHPLEDLLK